MTNERRVLVHPDKEALAGSVAARFITKIIDVLEEQEQSHVCLTGGTMGSAVLEAIGSSPARDSVDWSRIQFWWSDERYLPHGDPDRNDTQSRAALLDRLALDAAQIHALPAPGEQPDIDAAARAYEAELAASGVDGARYPKFDVMFLGVGPDGHVVHAGARQGQSERSGLVGAGEHQPDAVRRVDHGEREAEPLGGWLRRRRLGDHDTLRLVDQGVVGEQRGDVSVGADAEHHDVEQATAELVQRRRVGLGAVLGGGALVGAGHPVHVGRVEPQGGEPGGVVLGVVAVGVARGQPALVAPPHVHL